MTALSPQVETKVKNSLCRLFACLLLDFLHTSKDDDDDNDDDNDDYHRDDDATII